MRIRLSFLIVIAVCSLAFSEETKANRVIANTDVYYDAAQNRMVGYTEATSSYFAGMYYCLSVTVYLTTEGQSTGNSAWDGCLYGYARTEATLPYDPNAEYSVDGEHTAEPYYRNDLGQLIDYYNFQIYLEGIPVYYPGSYQFTGPGPRRPSTGAILLGTVLALFSQGSRHGPPHHLKVLSDETIESCGTKDRRIRVQVVDSSGRRAGTTQTKETFHDPNTGNECPDCAYNSCRGEYISASGCSTDIGGIFTDRLWVGCPLISGECGTAIFISKWSWCPRGRPSVPLATNTYHLGRSFVRVNGGDDIPDGTQLYP